MMQPLGVRLDYLSPSVGSQSNCFILSFSIFGYLTCRTSSNFLLVGSQVFHVRQQDLGSTQTFEGHLGKAHVLEKLYPLGCVISSSDTMIAPPGPWNIPLWPGLLVRTSTWTVLHLKLFCVCFFCQVDLHSVGFFTYYLRKFSVFKCFYVCAVKTFGLLSHLIRSLAVHLTSKPPGHFQSEICLEACLSLVEFHR